LRAASAALLRAVVDGVALSEPDAAALWKRFSAHMEEHKGDLAGFAAQEGFASVHPAMDAGGPLLVASRTSPQKPYAPVDGAGRGGSSGHQVDRRGAPRPGSKRRKRR
jgi:hypothetical protein